MLARHVAELLQRVLTDTKDPDRRVAIANDLIDRLESRDSILRPIEQLLQIAEPAAPGVIVYGATRPTTPLRDAALLTNASDEPSLGSELRAEIDTADEVDLLCAFVKWHGLRLLEPELDASPAAPGPAPGHHHDLYGRHRTGGSGSTRPGVRRHGEDPVRRPAHPAARQGVDVPSQHRLRHGVCRLVEPVSGGTAGRGRVERAAVAASERPALLDKFPATFDTYWNDPTFETYDPDRDRDRLDDALAEASGRTTHDRVTISLAGLEVRPVPLPAGDARGTRRRARGPRPPPQPGGGRNGNRKDRGRGARLPPTVRRCGGRPAVACCSWPTVGRSWSSRCAPTARCSPTRPSASSTSAGPTRALAPRVRQRPVAHVVRHRQHSRRRLRHRGDRRVPPRRSGDVPAAASISSTPTRVTRTHRNSRTRPTGWTSVSSSTGAPPLNSGCGTRSGADLLCPFHYFAVADGTDLRAVTWTRGRYDEAELSNVYTGNRRRAAIVLAQLRDKFLILAACAHWASASASITPSSWPGVSTRRGSPPRGERDDTSSRAVSVRSRISRVGGSMSCSPRTFSTRGSTSPTWTRCCSCGRPRARPSSCSSWGAGCGERRDKAVLTVLDFVGYHRKEFRWDRKLRALTGRNPSGPGTRDRTRVPVLAVGVPDRHGQTGSDRDLGQHQVPGREPLGADRCGACGPTETRI